MNTAVFRYDPTCEKRILKSPQAFQNPGKKSNSLNYGQSAAEAILNRIYAKKDTARSGVLFFA